MDKLFHSVYLDRSKCKGCTTCLRNCPTGAIRVRGGKARIIENKCIDCGECIRICPHHAKLARTDPLKSIESFKYKVAIPAPTLLGQFKQRYSADRILTALKSIGFDEVLEVAKGAETVGRSLEFELEGGRDDLPMISSACPAVSNLIQVRFPELVGNITTLKSPMTLTARMAREQLLANSEHNGLKDEDIGIFFITPGAAKATEVTKSLSAGVPMDRIDGAISIKDLFRPLSAALGKGKCEAGLHTASSEGFSWAVSGGESSYLGKRRHSLHVDGISNVISVLDEIECGRLSNIDFFEGLACTGGCVGGCLTVENNFVAKMRIEMRAENERGNVVPALSEDDLRTFYASGDMHREQPLEPRIFQPLDEDFDKAIEKMNEIERIEASLPGIDCGSCGAPGCRAHAEDIVKGFARKIDCIFVLRDRLETLARLTNEMLQMGQPMSEQEETEDESK